VLGYKDRAFANGGLARRGHLREQRCGVQRETGGVRVRKRGSE